MIDMIHSFDVEDYLKELQSKQEKGTHDEEELVLILIIEY